MKRKELYTLLENKDFELAAKMQQKIPPFNRQRARASELQEYLKGKLTPIKVQKLTKLLLSKKTILPNLQAARWRDLDGEVRQLLIARASSTEMWPMGTGYWVRDNALIAARLLNWPANTNAAKELHKTGKKVLLSALTVMSSQSQLNRFNNIVRSKSKAFKNSPKNWPQIFLDIKSNLNASQHEFWSHKQDAWQILAYYTLTALKNKQIKVSDLSAKQISFLGLCVPFLIAVDFINQENSGSWEEIPAVRNSVRAWEVSLLDLIRELSARSEFDFLNKEYIKNRKFLPKKYEKLKLQEALSALIQEAVKDIYKTFPNESAAYRKTDWRYRAADASLIYLLQLDFPALMLRELGGSVATQRKLEKSLLKAIESLRDPLTGGIRRYHQDSYQRENFFRFTTNQKLIELYGAPSGDASSSFSGRHKILPYGREASWCHFIWQLAAWALVQYQQHKDLFYWQIAEENIKAGLALVTGSNEFTVDIDKNNNVRVIKLPKWQIPECYISDRPATNKLLVFASPHTPLNWAAVEALAAIGELNRVFFK